LDRVEAGEAEPAPGSANLRPADLLVTDDDLPAVNGRGPGAAAPGLRIGSIVD
jgi:hypothetical protein